MRDSQTTGIPGRRKGSGDLPLFPYRYVWLMRFGPYMFVAVVGLTVSLSLLFARSGGVNGSDLDISLSRMVLMLLGIGAAVYAALYWSAVRYSDFRERVRQGLFEPRGMRRLWHHLVDLARPDSVLIPVLAAIGSVIFVFLPAFIGLMPFNETILILWPVILLPMSFVSSQLVTGRTTLLIVVEIILILVGGFALVRDNTFRAQIDIVICMFWLLCLWGLNHYVLRRIKWAETHTQAVGQIARSISENPEEVVNLFDYSERYPERFWLNLARQVSEVLNLPRFTILAYSKSAQRLYVRGIYAQQDPALNELSWSVNEGITGWVTRHQQAVLCPDVRWCSTIFKAVEGMKTLSELAVPIIVNGTVRGVLDVQSPKTFYFDNGTLAALATFAEAFAAVLAQVDLVERETADNYTLIRKVHEEMGQCKTLEDMLQVIAVRTCEFFGATNAVAFRLSPGLAWPIMPSLRAGNFQNEAMLETEITERSILHGLIESWEEVFAAGSIDDPRLQPPADNPDSDSFVRRESTASTAFLPLGTKSRKVGLLFVNYRQHHSFSNRDRLALRAFADAATLALLFQQDAEAGERAREVNRTIRHGPIRKALQNSRNLAESIKDNLESQQDLRALRTAMASMQDNMDSVEQSTLELLGNMESDTLFVGLESRPFEDLLASAAERLKHDPTQWLVLNIDSAIDDEPREVKAQLYSISYEAIHNALHHGQAEKVCVRIERWPWKIRLVARDNGRGYDLTDFQRHHADEQYKSWSPLGIKARLQLTKDIFGGEYRLRSRPGVGTVITVAIPARPIRR